MTVQLSEDSQCYFNVSPMCATQTLVLGLGVGLLVSLILKFFDMLVRIGIIHVQLEGEPRSSKQLYGIAFFISPLSMIWGTTFWFSVQQVGVLVTLLYHMLL